MHTLTLGIAISLTGRYALQGTQSFEGLCLWLRDVNAAGGIRVGNRSFAIELVHYDDQSSVPHCRQLVEQLITRDKVDLLLGPYGSGQTLAAAAVAHAHRKLLWNHGGASDELLEQGLSSVISALTPASRYLNGMIDLVRDRDPAAQSLVLISAEDSGFATRIAAGVRRYGAERGFDVSGLTYRSGMQDFSALLQRARAHAPDLILGAGRADDDLALAQQLEAHALGAKAIGLIVAGIEEFRAVLGSAADGYLGPSQWEPGMPVDVELGPTPREFAQRFAAIYAKAPDYPAAQGYTIGLILQRCLAEAGSVDDRALRDAALRVAFRTLYGEFQLDPDTGEQVGHRMVIVQWQQGAKYIVHPEGVAERPAIYPRR